MQRVTLIAVGNLKEKFWREAAGEYSKRLSRFCKLSIIEVAEGGGRDAAKNLGAEGLSIARQLPAKAVVLSPEGDKLSSEGFARLVGNAAADGSPLCFVIGGSDGLSDSVKAAAARVVSFSDMTFPHMLMRVILLEQLYRAYMINSNSLYHK